jgi:uncharacterized protein YkwD
MKKRNGLHLLIVFALAACGTKLASAPAAAGGGAVKSVPATQSPQSEAGQPAPEQASTSGGAPSADSAAPVTSAPGPSGASVSSSVCSDSAAFVSDVTVQDNTIFGPGEHFEKTWRIKNTGTCTWSDQYTLVFSKGNQMDAPDSSAFKGETAPGNTVDVSVNLIAPSDESVTRARADFEIHNAADASIPVDEGATLWVIIKVDNGATSKAELAGGAGGDASGPGFANVTCAFTTDKTKVTAVFAALNAYRATQGIAPYPLNDQLNTAAQAHAADMACNNLFYHNGSNGSTAKSRVAASGYIARAVTENVYGSFPPLSPADAILWWVNDTTDPRHNENLLSVQYVEVGIGYAFFNNFGYYVIDFAAP